MSIICAHDVSHVRFSAPDLEQMKGFLLDFGLVEKKSSDNDLWMGGLGAAPFLHHTVLGEPGFAALGFQARSLEDLEAIAEAHGAPVTNADWPGGGLRVTLTDPNGFTVDLVANQSTKEPEIAGASPVNTAFAKPRVSEIQRVSPGPARVFRLGHVVLEVEDFETSYKWYAENFGMLISDRVNLPTGDTIGAFMRFNRGDQLTDHHSLFLLQGPNGVRFNHAAFEVGDIDDVMKGHTHLKAKNHTPSWGVGRHILGSQIFDYWRDPWGHELEHWTDGDLFKASDPENVVGLDALVGTQWGEPHPMAAQVPDVSK